MSQQDRGRELLASLLKGLAYSAFSKALEGSAESIQHSNTSLSIKIYFLVHSNCSEVYNFLYLHHHHHVNNDSSVLHFNTSLVICT